METHASTFSRLKNKGRNYMQKGRNYNSYEHGRSFFFLSFVDTCFESFAPLHMSCEHPMSFLILTIDRYILINEIYYEDILGDSCW